MTRVLTATLMLGYLLLVPFCFFGGMAMAAMIMPEAPSLTGVNAHAHALSGCTVGAAIGCAHLADPHAPSGGHGDMYLSLTETPLQSLVFVLALVGVGFAIALADFVGPTLLRTWRIIRIASLRAPRAYTRRAFFARLALFEASPNPA